MYDMWHLPHKVNVSLATMLHPNLLSKMQRVLIFCIQVEYFSPCDSRDDISIPGIEAPPTYLLSVKYQVSVWYGCNEVKFQHFTTLFLERFHQ